MSYTPTSEVTPNTVDLRRTCYRHLAAAVHEITGVRPSPADDHLWLDPNALQQYLRRRLPGEVLVRGTLEHRLLLAQDYWRQWWVGHLAGVAVSRAPLPTWARRGIDLDEPDRCWSRARITAPTLARLRAPRLLLVALYHPEIFPLPRFPLGISDLARAARASLHGQVRLLDMQLGVDLEGVLDEVEQWCPDIIGISATFGQHDVMAELLDHLTTLESGPLLIAGGSLVARNQELLERSFPDLLVCRGAGEEFVADVLSYWHQDLSLDQVRGLAWRRRMLRVLPQPPEVRDWQVGGHAPELDLLPDTFAHHGVAQLEASRGCSSACTFCPRGHKGSWSSADLAQLRTTVRSMRSVFADFPQTSRTVYLVDEEFIGTGPGVEDRALGIASVLHREGMRWESSCRIDQIHDPHRDRQWHVDRARLFRELHRRGMRRMLFGVESGVDSVLDRFGKDVVGEQNTAAIRTLSALGIPTRFTYITFDPLVTLEELRQTHLYQGRTDLLLRPRPELTSEQIVAGIGDPGFLEENATGTPLYAGISYMLVSIECLTGSAYTLRATAAGLTGAIDPSMGRVHARYIDWRIGRCALHAQLWIDRNFALDYTLKSLEKVLDGEARHVVRAGRVLLKDAAYHLLGDMIGAAAEHELSVPTPQVLDAQLIETLDAHMTRLRSGVTAMVHDVLPHIPEGRAHLLSRQVHAWLRCHGWKLINDPDRHQPDRIRSTHDDHALPRRAIAAR